MEPETNKQSDGEILSIDRIIYKKVLLVDLMVQDDSEDDNNDKSIVVEGKTDHAINKQQSVCRNEGDLDETLNRNNCNGMPLLCLATDGTRRGAGARKVCVVCGRQTLWRCSQCNRGFCHDRERPKEMGTGNWTKKRDDSDTRAVFSCFMHMHPQFVQTTHLA